MYNFIFKILSVFLWFFMGCVYVSASLLLHSTITQDIPVESAIVVGIGMAVICIAALILTGIGIFSEWVQ